MKRCKKCWEEKEESEFHKSYSRCKECRSKAGRKEYRADIELSRLDGRIRWNDPKAKIRRAIKYMERYMKLLEPHVK